MINRKWLTVIMMLFSTTLFAHNQLQQTAQLLSLLKTKLSLLLNQVQKLLPQNTEKEQTRFWLVLGSTNENEKWDKYFSEKSKNDGVLYKWIGESKIDTEKLYFDFNIVNEIDEKLKEHIKTNQAGKLFDGIVFGEATVKFVEWTSEHLKAFSQYLKKEGVFFIPDQSGCAKVLLIKKQITPKQMDILSAKTNWNKNNGFHCNSDFLHCLYNISFKGLRNIFNDSSFIKLGMINGIEFSIIENKSITDGGKTKEFIEKLINEWKLSLTVKNMLYLFQKAFGYAEYIDNDKKILYTLSDVQAQPRSIVSNSYSILPNQQMYPGRNNTYLNNKYYRIIKTN